MNAERCTDPTCQDHWPMHTTRIGDTTIYTPNPNIQQMLQDMTHEPEDGTCQTN
jgi:hypothetical protein